MLDAIRSSLIGPTFKGFPANGAPCTVAEAGDRGWNLLQGDLGSPVAVLREPVLANNVRWMRGFLERTGASLCPHGKTTMAPQLFHRQVADGAWGITLATPQQARIAVEAGIKRILLANQVVDAGALSWLKEAREADHDLDIVCLVDSLEGITAMAAHSSISRPLTVLLELGIPGGRTGCRSSEEGLALARAIKAAPSLQLCGVACYEGILVSPEPETDRQRIETWLAALAELGRVCDAEELFETDEILLTAGGSAYFDLVVHHLGSIILSRPTRLVLRSGCYLSHDAGHYARLISLLEGRLPEAWRPTGHLEPALEVWGTVLSRPEAGLAYLDLGKRDVSHDLHLPRPHHQHRLGWPEPRQIPESWSVTALYDQHLRLALPADSDVRVGDRIGLAISHPCTTFDKWPLVWRVDAAWTAVEAIRTYF